MGNRRSRDEECWLSTWYSWYPVDDQEDDDDKDDMLMIKKMTIEDYDNQHEDGTIKLKIEGKWKVSTYQNSRMLLQSLQSNKKEHR